MTAANNKKQQGYVMVSMLALVIVMGGLGASMYSDVSGQEKMSASLRIKKRVFSAADSVVQSVWNLTDLLGSSGTNHTQVRRIDKDEEYDTTNLDLDAEAVICFGGNGGGSGFGGNGMDADESAEPAGGGFFMFTAYGDASNTASGAASRVAMGGYMQGPAITLPAVTPCP